MGLFARGRGMLVAAATSFALLLSVWALAVDSRADVLCARNKKNADKVYGKGVIKAFVGEDSCPSAWTAVSPESLPHGISGATGSTGATGSSGQDGAAGVDGIDGSALFEFSGGTGSSDLESGFYWSVTGRYPGSGFADVGVLVSSSCSNLQYFIALDTPPGTSAHQDFQLIVGSGDSTNGSTNSAFTLCDIPDPDTNCSGTVPVTIAAGELISLKSFPTVPIPASTRARWSIRCTVN